TRLPSLFHTPATRSRAARRGRSPARVQPALAWRSTMERTKPTNDRDISRRRFLRWGLASGGLAPVVLRGRYGATAALAQATAKGEAPKKGGTLRVGFYIEAATMDPHLSGSKIDRQIYHNIYEPLVTLDTKLGIRPGLAESWTQPEPRILIFKLRHGV